MATALLEEVREAVPQEDLRRMLQAALSQKEDSALEETVEEALQVEVREEVTLEAAEGSVTRKSACKTIPR